MFIFASALILVFFKVNFFKVLDKKDKVTFIKSVVKEFSNKTFYLHEIGFFARTFKIESILGQTKKKTTTTAIKEVIRN